MTFPQKIRAARLNGLVTQAEFAQTLGVSRVTVARWETGVQRPSLTQQRRLATMYGIRLRKKARVP